MSDTIIGNKKHEQGIEDITHWSKKPSGTRPVKNSASIKCWAAYDSSGESVQIESAVKGRTYFCPDCNEKMNPRLGPKNAHHFSHNPNQNGDTPHCGGEGYRHFRAKTFLHRLMSSIPKYEFKYSIDIQMERKFGQDQPDILVIYKNDLALAFEIIDTNPPSEEKRGRWGDKMVEIDISGWRDNVLKDSSMLSGRLIPYLIKFQKFVDSLKHEIVDYSQELGNIRKKIIVEHIDEIDKLKSIHQEKVSTLESKTPLVEINSRIMLENPNWWGGSYAKLDDDEIIDEKYGVRVKTGSGEEPQSGDNVAIRTRKGELWYGILGTLIKEFDFPSRDFETCYIFHLSYRRRAKSLVSNISESDEIINKKRWT